MVEVEIANGRVHVLAFPWPGQGHLNPMLQFVNLLASRGLKVTVITTTSTYKTAQINSTNLVNFDCISDGSDDQEKKKPKDIQEYFALFKSVISQSLAEIIEKYNSSDDAPKVLVYDSLMPWALDLAREKGLVAACLFTQSCSVSSIYYNLLEQGKDRSALLEGGSVGTLPPLPKMQEDEMPCFSYFKDASRVVQDFLAGQFCNIDKLDWIFFNTFDKLEEEVAEWMTSQWPVKTVGPLFLSSYLKNQEKAKIDLFKPSTEACKDWLNTRETGSVIYISFGSTVCISKEEMEEIAWGIAASNYSFLWVVRESEESKLTENFKTETSKKGLIVKWCPQLEVLDHKAVACFMTHCGWNSTLEALSFGVPMILMPQYVDQTTNAKFIEDVWRDGVRLRKQGGILTRDTVENCLNQFMHEERLKMLQENACELKALAIKAIHEGGSSYANIDEFVSMVA
ncbi:transferase [Lithospermum erythrorhizon]|uniref:Glycosyltransferase n=1 Tax=Lithospermum erythrorhizon TaxID=34254 RepID=A0AAV3RJ60_LITER